MRLLLVHLRRGASRLIRNRLCRLAPLSAYIIPSSGLSMPPPKKTLREGHDDCDSSLTAVTPPAARRHETSPLLSSGLLPGHPVS